MATNQEVATRTSNFGSGFQAKDKVSSLLRRKPACSTAALTAVRHSGTP